MISQPPQQSGKSQFLSLPFILFPRQVFHSDMDLNAQIKLKSEFCGQYLIHVMLIQKASKIFSSQVKVTFIK